MRVGVLALQGGFAAHVAALRELGVAPSEVRHAAQLVELDGLVLPGGETTTLLNLMRDEPWFEALREFHAGGGAILATCAGAILLAREVSAPAQPSAGLLDVTIERNAWGRQIDSFEVELKPVGESTTLRAVFIRAPRFRSIGAEVQVLAEFDGEPVLVQERRILAATFHPELSGSRWLHQRFIAQVREVEEAPGAELQNKTKRSAPSGPVQQRRVSC